jgi:hypothetical protein
MEKSTVTTHGDALSVGVLFTKIDKQNRTVSGFATLDNVDAHGDIITASASRSAFQRFRGGLREMHQPNAVGTVVSFEDAKLYDRESDRVYEGVYVTAKVSAGAPTTWEKVLDGTLKGFSIGGKIKQKVRRYIEDTKSEHNVIDEYDLIELSLVDNPANPLANVLTVQKVGDSFVFPDDDVVEKTLNILLHEETQAVVLSEDSERDGYINIGWTDSQENTEKIRAAIQDYETSSLDAGDEVAKAISHDNTQADMLDEAQNTNEGGATVTTDITKDADVVEEPVDEVQDDNGVVESADVTEVEEEADADADDEVEKAADVAEVTDEPDVDVDAIVAKVTAAVADELAKAMTAAKESGEAASAAQSSIDEAVKSLGEQISSLNESLNKTVDGLAKRVDELDSETAFKKSADIVEDDDAEEDEGETDIWRGVFLTGSSNELRS